MPRLFLGKCWASPRVGSLTFAGLLLLVRVRGPPPFGGVGARGLSELVHPCPLGQAGQLHATGTCQASWGRAGLLAPSVSEPTPSGDRSTPPGAGGGCGGRSECLVPRSRGPARLCHPGCHLAEGHCGPILTSSLSLFALWTAEEGQTDSQRGDIESPRETEEPGGRSSTWTWRGWAAFRAACDNKMREVTPCCLCRLTGTSVQDAEKTDQEGT